MSKHKPKAGAGKANADPRMRKHDQRVKPALPPKAGVLTEQDAEATEKFLLAWHGADASKLDAALAYAPTLAGMFERAKQAGENVKDWAGRSLPFTYMTATKILRLHAWSGLLLAAREHVGGKFPIGVELGIEVIKHAEGKGLVPNKKPTKPLLLELSRDAKAAFDAKKAKVRSGRRGSGRQATPAERPPPGTTRITPDATGIDWFCKTHGPIYAFLEGTAKRLNEYLAGEADWPDGQPLSLAATRQSAERCAALLAKVVARVDALLANPEEDEPDQIGE
jgi:hypothetical protein